MYRYFISYFYDSGLGRVEFQSEKEILSIKDLERVEAEISKTLDGKKIIVQNWILFPEKQQ